MLRPQGRYWRATEPIGPTTAVLPESNGVEIPCAGNDDVYELVIEIPTGQPSVDEIVERQRGFLA